MHFVFSHDLWVDVTDKLPSISPKLQIQNKQIQTWKVSSLFLKNEGQMIDQERPFILLKYKIMIGDN